MCSLEIVWYFTQVIVLKIYPSILSYCSFFPALFFSKYVSALVRCSEFHFYVWSPIGEPFDNEKIAWMFWYIDVCPVRFLLFDAMDICNTSKKGEPGSDNKLCVLGMESHQSVGCQHSWFYDVLACKSHTNVLLFLKPPAAEKANVVLLFFWRTAFSLLPLLLGEERGKGTLQGISSVYCKGLDTKI